MTNLYPFDNYWAHFGVFTVIVLVFVISGVMAFIYIERRGFGLFQMRLGPNRAGPFGLLQPIADAIKVLLKEDIVPTVADKTVHFLAPIVGFLPVLLILSMLGILAACKTVLPSKISSGSSAAPSGMIMTYLVIETVLGYVNYPYADRVTLELLTFSELGKSSGHILLLCRMCGNNDGNGVIRS